MVFVALALALVAILVGWGCGRTIKGLKERNAQLNSKIYNLRLEMREVTEAHQKAIAQLKIEMMRQAGNLRLTGDMTIDEIQLAHPQATSVLAGFHIGGCASCAVDGSTRLNEAITERGDLELALLALNNLVTEVNSGSVSSERLKIPNAELAT